MSVQIHGPALRCVREMAGRSIGQLARAAGCSTGFLARVERGVKRGVNEHVFAVLVAELGLDDPRVILVDPYGVANRQPMAYSGLQPERVNTRAA